MFITDQPPAATKGNNLTGDTNNGLIVKNDSVRAIKAIMFN